MPNTVQAAPAVVDGEALTDAVVVDEGEALTDVVVVVDEVAEVDEDEPPLDSE